MLAVRPDRVTVRDVTNRRDAAKRRDEIVRQPNLPCELTAIAL